MRAFCFYEPRLKARAFAVASSGEMGGLLLRPDKLPGSDHDGRGPEWLKARHVSPVQEGLALLNLAGALRVQCGRLLSARPDAGDSVIHASRSLKLSNPLVILTHFCTSDRVAHRGSART